MNTYASILQAITLLAALAASAHAQEPARSAPLAAAMDSVSVHALRAHMRVLADDLLEGRGAGTRGYDLAALYVASQFEQLGLTPAGDDHSYRQWLTLRSTEEIEPRCAFTLVGDGERELVFAEHYLMWGDPLNEATAVDAPLAYVGYGVTAPELGYDDYAGIDVEGKVVVMLHGGPPTFPHNQRAYHASGRVKSELAASRGAVGIVTFLTPADAVRRPWTKTVVNSSLPSMRYLEPDGRPHGVFPQIEIEALLSTDGAWAVFDGAALSLDEIFAAAEAGEARALELPWRGRFTRASRHETLRSSNVAGLLRGSDATLADEVLVYTAHLDHLGIGEPVDGDRIYNGAFDNASGIAAMLETARALAQMPRPPRRSVLFLAVTGEEKGLLGSEYFAEHPTVPIQTIVANINLDMFLMLHPMQDLIAFGEEHSTLSGPVRRAAARLGFAVAPDPMPEEVIFIRSDQYSFVKKGVPAVFLVAGLAGQQPGKMNQNDWLREIYHTQRDDLNQHIDYQAGVTFARANLLIGYEIANADERPQWNEGDFFGEMFSPR